MTTSELIEELNKYEPDAEVMLMMGFRMYKQYFSLNASAAGVHTIHDTDGNEMAAITGSQVDYSPEDEDCYTEERDNPTKAL